MPICHAPGCVFDTLDLRAGHKCTKCKKEVHTLCAHELPDQPTESNLLCYACYPRGSPITPAIISQLLQRGIEEKNSAKRKEPPGAVPNKKTATLKKAATAVPNKKTAALKKAATAVPNKKTAALKKAATALNKDDQRIKKSGSQQKSFTLKTNKAQEDALVMQSVWFDIQSQYGQELSIYFGAEKLKIYLFQDGAKQFLKGTVARKSKQKVGGGRFYDVQWESHDLGETSCELDPMHYAEKAGRLCYFLK
jgi:hypothetical protein